MAGADGPVSSGGLASFASGDGPLMRASQAIDAFTRWSGRLFCWLVLPLMGAMSYEVVVRYAARPTIWAYDISYMVYGALFMLGAFCAVTTQKLLTISKHVKDDSITFFDTFKDVPYLKLWFGDFGLKLIDYSVPLSILLAIPVMLLVGIAMERGVIRHF